MKVKSHGFRLQPVGEATIGQLADRLTRRSGEEFTFRQMERRLYCSVTTAHSEVFAVGLFLTIRDHKRFLQLQNDRGTLTVKVSELDDQTSPFDFNFFIIHTATGSGLYSSYYSSCSLPMFHSFLRDQYLRTLKELEDGTAISEKERVRQSKKRNLQLQIFHRRDSFEDAVRQLAEVKLFEYDILTPASMATELQPISSKLKLERRQVRFEAGLTGDSFLSHIKSLIPANPLNSQRFRVVGEDTSGDRVPIDLVAPPDHFSEDEFDDLADSEEWNLADIVNSPYIQKLLQIFNHRKSFFTASVGN
jgi:hypothetical protein